MKQFFLMRITEELSDTQSISLEEEYLGGEAQLAKEGDLFICYVKGSLNVIGIYQLTKNKLECVEKTEMPLQDCYECFSFVLTIDENTSRMFKKKTREVSEDDFKKCVAKLIPLLHQSHIMTLL